MMKMIKNILSIFIVLGFFIFIANIFGKGWIIYHDGPYKGKVIDANTGEPVEGAVVYGTWNLQFIGHLQGPCDAVESVTYKNGEFVLPAIYCNYFSSVYLINKETGIPKSSWFFLFPYAFLDKGYFTVFKPGYLAYPPINFKESHFTGEEFEDRKKRTIIKLGKPKTREERKRTIGIAELGFGIFDSLSKKGYFLRKFIDEERGKLSLPIMEEPTEDK